MIKIKKYSLVFVAAMLVINMAAQENKTGSFSLQQAIEYAVKNSPNYLNAELDKQNAVYRRNEITGIGLPQINGSVDIKDYINIPTSLLPGQFFGQPAGTYIPVKFGTKYNSTLGVSASQLIFNSDYIFGLKASEEFLNLSQINANRTKSELVAQVSKAYYMVLINYERMKAIESNVSRFKKMNEDMKAYNQQGFVELIDVERSEVVYNNVVSEREKIQKLIGLTETMLKFQMGYKLTDAIELTDALPSTNDSENLNAGAIDISKRPDYQLAKSNQTLLDIDVKRLKYGYLPSLVAYGTYQLNAQRQTFNFFQFDKNDVNKQWFKISLIGATLNLNIFDGLQRHNRIQQAKISSLKNQNSLKMLEMAFEFEATSANINYVNAYTTLTTQKKNMELAEHVLDVVNKKFGAGYSTNLEIVNAQTSLKEAQTNYYNAIYDMIVAKIDYQKATGTLVK